MEFIILKDKFFGIFKWLLNDIRYNWDQNMI